MRTLKHPRVRGGRLWDDQTPAFGRSVADGPHADIHRHPPTPTDTHRHPPTPTNTRRASPPPPPPGTSTRAPTRALARRHRRGCCRRIGSCVESRQLKSSRLRSLKYNFKVVYNPPQVRYHRSKCRSLGLSVDHWVKMSVTGLKCRSLGESVDHRVVGSGVMSGGGRSVWRRLCRRRIIRVVVSSNCTINS